MTYKHLSIEEREVIQGGLWDKRSVRSIATQLGRSVSSVSREINKNIPSHERRYTPRLANERAQKRRTSRGRKERLKNAALRSYVVSKLKLRWSPEQIAARAKRDGVGLISHEAIYQFVYAEIYRQGHGYVRPGREDLRMYLRRKRKRRTHHGMRRSQRVLKPLGPSIDERPEVVGTRTRIGDWESDTVESRDHKPGINTLVERKTGLVLISKLRDKTGAATASVIAKRLRPLPRKAKHTITFDNGPENRDWREIKVQTGADPYFAHPYHSWERGTNENTNGLARDYWPKKTDFTLISDAEIAKVEYDLNTRPRKRLGWLTPLEAWSVALKG